MYISKTTAALLLAALLIGFGAGFASAGIKSQPAHTMEHSSMEGSMDMMSEMLKGKTGAELEHTFLDEMIVHHEGAIEMANQLKAGTTRPELLKMADDIIRTQTQEVDMMRMWSATWFEH